MKFSKSVKNYIASLVVTAVMAKAADVIVEKVTGKKKSSKSKSKKK